MQLVMGNGMAWPAIDSVDELSEPPVDTYGGDWAVRPRAELITHLQLPQPTRELMRPVAQVLVHVWPVEFRGRVDHTRPLLRVTVLRMLHRIVTTRRITGRFLAIEPRP